MADWILVLPPPFSKEPPRSLTTLLSTHSAISSSPSDPCLLSVEPCVGEPAPPLEWRRPSWRAMAPEDCQPEAGKLDLEDHDEKPSPRSLREFDPTLRRQSIVDALDRLAALPGRPSLVPSHILLIQHDNSTPSPPHSDTPLLSPQTLLLLLLPSLLACDTIEGSPAEDPKPPALPANPPTIWPRMCLLPFSNFSIPPSHRWPPPDP
mmetsp:Transcript_17619/g.40684  ORF Transcript_17619/g.40684 Transcript_17619/m.40684 type:complete len:207 (+) Transcript_17619:212-832(+)